MNECERRQAIPLRDAPFAHLHRELSVCAAAAVLEPPASCQSTPPASHLAGLQLPQPPAMAATAVRNKNTISLKGSATIVAEYFNFAVNSILYQRGIYPQDSFQQQSSYGLSVWVSRDDGLSKYLRTVCGQMQAWLEQGMLQRLVLVISSALGSREVLERWTFVVDTNKEVLEGKAEVEKGDDVIKKEIAAIMRQIFASVSFLPLLEDPCTFDLLVYTSKDSEVPKDWCESDPCYITNATDMKLRSFTTKVHKVDTAVTYKAS